MSWFLGAFGSEAPARWGDAIRDARSGSLLSTFEVSSAYVECGGLTGTAWYECVDQAKTTGWVVVGTAVHRSNGSYDLVEHQQWRSRLAHSRPNFSNLGGHYAGIRFDEDEVMAFVDSRGIRTVYWVRIEGYLLVSTRLDWLAQIAGEGKIDYHRFGSHWQFANQLSAECLVDGIRRLGPGRRLRWTGSKVQLIGSGWTPDVSKKVADLEQALRDAVQISQAGGGVSLGLSGGLDSRTLLAAGGEKPDFHVHTFGPDSTADAKIAGRLIPYGEDRHALLWSSIPGPDRCIELVRDLLNGTAPVSPASSALKSRLYAQLKERDRLLVDGGFGEIVRRGYYRRLIAWDAKALLGRETKAVEPYLRTSRADIFSEGVNRRMKEGRRVDLEEVLSSLPTDDGIRAGDLADHLALRTRLPNFFGRAQAHLDERCRNLMPYALPDVLQAAFSTSLSDRSGARAVRSMIRQEMPRLARIPLARGTVTVPFWMPETPAYVWSRIKRSCGWTYDNPVRSDFLGRIEPWVRDTVRSRSVRQYEPYDSDRLQLLIEGYYEEGRDSAAAVDWWVAFECWRRTLL